MLKYLMCSSRKCPYRPHIRFFLCKIPPLWKFKLSFMHFFIKVRSYSTHPQEIPIPSMGAYGSFLHNKAFIVQTFSFFKCRF